MYIGFFTHDDWEQAFIQEHAVGQREDLTFSFIEGVVSSDSLPDRASELEAISIFVDSIIDATVLDAMPKLRFIATRSTGFDHIDLKECMARNIVVSNVPAYGENTVAEYSMALLANLMRRIAEGYDRLRDDGQFSPQGLEGRDLLGKTIGIIGTGNIGKCTIRIAKGFGMNVVAHDPYPDEAHAQEVGYEYVPLDELFAQSDAISLHVPYLESTHHLINKETIEKMKDGAYLVNTSRGAVVDTEALATALQKGKLAGAALDVLEEEGHMKDELQFFTHTEGKDYNVKTALVNYVLIDMPNVIVTPHNAFNTREALVRIITTSAENLALFADGSPQNVVTKK